MSNSGVYPCYENQFQIDTAGGSGNAAALKPIAGMESFSVAIDGNVEEWKPFEAAGWTRRLVTGKSLTISITGKRNIGDEGNDYVNSLALKTGSGASTTLVWTFPRRSKAYRKGSSKRNRVVIRRFNGSGSFVIRLYVRRKAGVYRRSVRIRKPLPVPADNSPPA